MKNSLLWAIRQLVLVILYRRFGTTSRSIKRIVENFFLLYWYAVTSGKLLPIVSMDNFSFILRDKR